ncbi:MAG: VanZ family protein [Flavobacteriales bacterium]|nr:MAG: VanZ family protein [Flavobacteriales bacterium]
MLWIPSKAVPRSIAAMEDWIIHGAIMAVAAVLLVYARLNQGSWNSFVVYTLLFFTIYSLLTEFVQRFIPGRSFSWSDVIANLTGVVIVLVAVSLYRLRNRE